MDFEDDAFVLSARAHGEAGAIVELLTAPMAATSPTSPAAASRQGCGPSCSRARG